MANDGTVKIGVELDEKELEKSFKKLDEQAQKTSKELSKIDDALKLDPTNIDLLTEKQKLLTSAVADSKTKVESLAKELQKAKESGLQDSDADAYRDLVVAFSNAESEAKSFEKQLDDVNEKIKNGGKEAKDFSSALSKLGSVASTALKGGIAAIGGVATAATGAVAGLLALESATEEYRIAQGKLNTAFEAAGYGAETAAEAYNAFYGILGDTDTATEASQLLAKLALNAEDMSTWTNIAAGVWGTFGDALPIEGLIESANETARTGTVVGTLADALNWASINEDEFNEKLAAAGSEAERNQLIMETLSATYDDAADAFYRNNEALVASREAQSQMDEALAKLGQAVADVKTNVTSDFLPAVSQITEGFAGIITGAEGAEQQFSAGIQGLIDVLVEKLPDFLDFGVQIVLALVNGILSNLSTIVDAATQIILQLAYQIIELLPQLAESALQIILQLANFLIQSLPELIPAVVQIVLQIVETLVDNIDLIIDAAVDLILALAEGLIEALPILIDKAPEIISKLASALIEEGPRILLAAMELMTMLNEGIVKGFLQILGQIGSLVYDYLIQPLLDEVSAFADVGRQFVEGLWNGIGDKVEWLKGKVTGVVDTIKSWFTGSEGFDTHSPSKWSEEIGGNIDEGLAQGMTKGKNTVRSAALDIVGAASALRDAIPSATLGVSYANAAMTPSSASTPRFTTENAVASAAGMLALSQSSGSREIVLTLNGIEMARAIIDNIRAVESQSPAIISD